MGMKLPQTFVNHWKGWKMHLLKIQNLKSAPDSNKNKQEFNTTNTKKFFKTCLQEIFQNSLRLQHQNWTLWGFNNIVSFDTDWLNLKRAINREKLMGSRWWLLAIMLKSDFRNSNSLVFWLRCMVRNCVAAGAGLVIGDDFINSLVFLVEVEGRW